MSTINLMPPFELGRFCELGSKEEGKIGLFKIISILTTLRKLLLKWRNWGMDTLWAKPVWGNPAYDFLCFSKGSDTYLHVFQPTRLTITSPITNVESFPLGTTNSNRTNWISNFCAKSCTSESKRSCLCAHVAICSMENAPWPAVLKRNFTDEFVVRIEIARTTDDER